MAAMVASSEVTCPSATMTRMWYCGGEGRGAEGGRKLRREWDNVKGSKRVQLKLRSEMAD